MGTGRGRGRVDGRRSGLRLIGGEYDLGGCAGGSGG
jgi:hypothetical protein